MSRASAVVALFVGGIILLPMVNAPEACAGVLIESSRVTTGVSNQRPRAHLSRAKKSTYAASRTMPALGKKSVWGVETELSLLKQQEKHLKQVYKWEQKRLRKLQKELRKQQKQQEKLEKKLKKQREALLKKQKKLGTAEIKKGADEKEIKLKKEKDLNSAKTQKGRARSPHFGRG